MNIRDQLLRKAKKKKENWENDWSSYKRPGNKVNDMINKSKNKTHRDRPQENAASPDKFSTTIKNFFFP